MHPIGRRCSGAAHDVLHLVAGPIARAGRRHDGGDIGDGGEASVHRRREALAERAPDTTVRVLAPSENGGAQHGVEYKWVDENGVTNRFRVQGRT